MQVPHHHRQRRYLIAIAVAYWVDDRVVVEFREDSMCFTGHSWLRSPGKVIERPSGTRVLLHVYGRC